jgi:anti-anti-sigma factor
MGARSDIQRHGRARKGQGGMLGEVQARSDATVARLYGDLDLANVDALRELLADISATTSPRVVVDLREVPFVDVLSLSVIMGTADELRESGRQLIVEGASTSVRKLCALLNAEDILSPVVRLPDSGIPSAC